MTWRPGSREQTFWHAAAAMHEASPRAAHLSVTHPKANRYSTGSAMTLNETHGQRIGGSDRSPISTRQVTTATPARLDFRETGVSEEGCVNAMSTDSTCSMGSTNDGLNRTACLHNVRYRKTARNNAAWSWRRRSREVRQPSRSPENRRRQRYSSEGTRTRKSALVAENFVAGQPGFFFTAKAKLRGVFTASSAYSLLYCVGRPLSRTCRVPATPRRMVGVHAFRPSSVHPCDLAANERSFSRLCDEARDERKLPVSVRLDCRSTTSCGRSEGQLQVTPGIDLVVSLPALLLPGPPAARQLWFAAHRRQQIGAVRNGLDAWRYERRGVALKSTTQRPR